MAAASMVWGGLQYCGISVSSTVFLALPCSWCGALLINLFIHHAGSALAKMAIEEMVAAECDEVVLEAEVTNAGALALYRSLGFIRDKRLHR